MANAKTIIKYICSECGHITTTKTGKCPSCGSWGTFEPIEETPSTTSSSKKNLSHVKVISALDVKPPTRLATGIDELDRVLGGGLVPGGVVFLGGQPGIGKSTLLLQAAGSVAKNYDAPVLYISGEESDAQVALRASRINTSSEKLFLYSGSDLEDALSNLDSEKFAFFVLDSVQAMSADNGSGWIGTVTQVRAVAQRVVDCAREKKIPAVMIGHITKDGKIAGPMMLEHMVDTVLNFSGEGYSAYRMLRAVKNRYGSTEELGIFEMSGGGLMPVEDKSGLYWNRDDSAVPGVAMTIALEGNTPLAAEIQTLAARTVFPYPKRTSRGIEINRFQLFTAVIDRRCNISTNSHDLYINVAGGLSLQDPSADLPACAAIASALKNVSLQPGTCWLGEVGLAGEIRPVTRIDLRLKEAARLGFHTAVVSSREQTKFSGIKIIRVSHLYEALAGLLGR
ncbi:MAG: DNA repair protein RadA [Synergistaceae bacterium]|nr:DNA repair protein RadA [Synergistaceae bacterium]